MAPQPVYSQGPIRVWSLLASGDAARIEAMLGMYARLFPQYAHYVPRMRRRAALAGDYRPGQVVHYWLVEVDGKPAALRTFRYMREHRMGLAHALAVEPAFRQVQVDGQRLSMFLVHACLLQVVEDARRCGDPPVLGMSNEVESPRLMAYYEAQGILRLPVKYVEPVFPPEQPGRTREEELALTVFTPMFLGFLPAEGTQDRGLGGELAAECALTFLVDHYGLPAEHPQVQAVLDSIPVPP